jgi:hypothetical protein
VSDEPTTQDKSAVAALALKGDLTALTPEQKVAYYLNVCESLKLNPLTKPFQVLLLNGKQVLYATRDCTDQLRKVHSVSVTSIRTETINDIYVVVASGRDASGRTDVGTGAVPIKGLSADNLANAFMKAETKAKRRLTLSICGLGMMDETEVETVRDATPVDDPVIERVVSEAEKKKADEVKNREAEIQGWARSGLLTSMELSGLRDDMQEGGEWAEKAYVRMKKVYENRMKVNEEAKHEDAGGASGS